MIFLIATVPVWPYSRIWRLWPSGALGLVLVILGGLLGAEVPNGGLAYGDG